MIGAVALQVITGFLRVAALEAKQSNFSLLHRVRGYGGGGVQNDLFCYEFGE